MLFPSVIFNSIMNHFRHEVSFTVLSPGSYMYNRQYRAPVRANQCIITYINIQATFPIVSQVIAIHISLTSSGHEICTSQRLHHARVIMERNTPAIQPGKKLGRPRGKPAQCIVLSSHTRTIHIMWRSLGICRFHALGYIDVQFF
jgi:hypothetical protein